MMGSNSSVFPADEGCSIGRGDTPHPNPAGRGQKRASFDQIPSRRGEGCHETEERK